MNPLKSHKQAIKKFAWPYLSSAIVLVSGLLVYFLAVRQFGVEGFSEYALSRRSVSLVQPLLFQGFGLALTRQVAMAGANSDGRSPYTYLVTILLFFSVVLLALGGVTYFFTESLSTFFFGSVAYCHCIGPIAFVLVGIILHGAAWAYLRGQMSIAQACLLESLNLGILPLAAFLIGDSPSAILWWTGCFTTIASTGILLLILLRERQPIARLREHSKDLFQYAIPRIPGALALAALLSLPATVCAHVADVRYAGFVAFGCSLLGMAGTLISPLGVVLLPQSAKMIASGRVNDVKSLVPKLLGISIGVSILIVLSVEILAEPTVAYFMGAEAADLVGIIRLMIISSIPFLIYLSLRSILDGATRRALNSRNCIVALASLLVFVGITYSLGGGVNLILIGSIGSMSILAALTLFETYRVLEGAQFE